MPDPSPPFRTAPPHVVLRDAAAGTWRCYESPQRVLVARRLDEVMPVIRAAERAALEGGHAAGFLWYEAAPAFDPHLVALSDGDFPCAWFGVFDEPRLLAELPLPGAAGAGQEHWQPTVTPDEYRAAFDRLREYIRDGDTYQVNLTFRLRAHTGSDAWSAFLTLAGGGRIPYAAFVDTGDWAVCSGSPELFFRLDGDVIESRPMKGTAARGLWPEEDRRRAAALAASPKERAENVMITDMVRNDLGRVSLTGTVHVPQLCGVERYPTVWQMTSTVRARTDASLEAILAGLFPPASIVGVPRRRAMEIITELESTPRRIYTGAIGHVEPGRRAQFNVAIRTLLVEQATGRAEYGVGGGIVWDSQCERELEECRVKARALGARPTDFELLETLRWDRTTGYALLARHLDRLAQSADYFGIVFDRYDVEERLARAPAALDCASARVRLTVDRRGQVSCNARPLCADETAFPDIALANAPVDRTDVFLYHKTTQRTQYARALATRPGFADVLLWNQHGEITESTIANVAVELDGALWTPPVDCGLLAGTCRAQLLAEGRLHERVIRREDLPPGATVFLMNAVRGLQRVRVLDGEPLAVPSA